MNSIFLKQTFIFLLAITRVWAYGGSEAGNGGGLSEKNILFAYKHLNEYVDLCLKSRSCQLNAIEKALLEKIREVLPQEQKTPLVFFAESAKPGFFIIDGMPKIAKTGSLVGDPIYINLDLLYAKQSQNTYQFVDLPLSASILLHELGHHQGILDHALLDHLGTAMQTFLLTHSLRAEFWNGNAALITFQNNSVRSDKDKKHLRFMDQILLENGNELYDLQQDILSNIHCPLKTQKALGLRLYNVHEERGLSFDPQTQILKKPAVAWYVLSCKQDEESDHGDLKLELTFKKREDGTFEYLPQQFKVKQESCFLFPKACR